VFPGPGQRFRVSPIPPIRRQARIHRKKPAQ